MKILFFTMGPELLASSRNRIHEYLPYLYKEGIKSKIINYISLNRCKKNINLIESKWYARIIDKIFMWWQTLKIIFFAPYYDILFIQKVLLPEPILKLLKKLNNNIIFDFDDAIYLSDKFTKKHIFSRNNSFLDRFKHTLCISKYVIVENEYNESFTKKLNPNVVIITGPINTSRYIPKPPSKHVYSHADKVVIGWIGSPDTTMYVKLLIEVFKTLARKYRNLSVTLIGSSNFNIEGVDLSIKKWRLDTEVKDLQTLDIGIMPLEDDRWSWGKGGYKLLQYMAIGIPCVASPVGVNRKIVKNGITGFLAHSEDEWIDKLSVLLENKELRHRMGKEGRLRAEAFYSYEVCFPKFLDMINKCVK